MTLMRPMTSSVSDVVQLLAELRATPLHKAVAAHLDSHPTCDQSGNTTVADHATMLLLISRWGPLAELEVSLFTPKMKHGRWSL